MRQPIAFISALIAGCLALLFLFFLNGDFSSHVFGNEKSEKKSESSPLNEEAHPAKLGDANHTENTHVVPASVHPTDNEMRIVKLQLSELRSKLREIERKRVNPLWSQDLGEGRHQMAFSIIQPSQDEIGMISTVIGSSLSGVPERIRLSVRKDFQRCYDQFINFPMSYKIGIAITNDANSGILDIIEMDTETPNEFPKKADGSILTKGKTRVTTVDLNKSSDRDRFGYLFEMLK